MSVLTRTVGGAAPEPARVHCIECDARLELDETGAGTALTCGLCGTQIEVGERRTRRRRRRRSDAPELGRVENPVPGLRRCCALAALAIAAFLVFSYRVELADFADDFGNDVLQRLRDAR